MRLRHRRIRAAYGDSLQAGGLFGSFYRGVVDYEVSLIPKHRADVVVAVGHRSSAAAVPQLVLEGWQFVVECQASPLAVPAWEERTEAYAAEGYAVLWLWCVE